MKGIRRFKKVGKLIRDKFPEWMRNQKVIVHEEILDQADYIERLKEKLLKEALELTKAQSRKDLTKGVADTLDVIHALLQSTGITMHQIDESRRKKIKSKARFDERIYNHVVEIEKSNPKNFKTKKYSEIANTCVSCPACLFCKISKQEIQTEIIAQFEHCYVIKDAYPVSQGHLLIIPHTHTEHWMTAAEEVQMDVINAISEMKKILDKDYNPDGYNIGINCGRVAGQTVMHLHVHLIPRYNGDMEDPTGGIRGVIPSKQKYEVET